MGGNFTATSRLAAFIALAATLGALAPVSEAARIKCWTNSEGVRECGNVVPPEYAQKGHREINKAGLTVKRQSAAVSKEQREAELSAKLAKEESERKQKQRRDQQAAEDRVLLDTFVSEQDVTRAHERKMSAIKSRIAHQRTHMGRLGEKLAQFQTKAANQERSGQTVAETTIDNIDDVQRQIDQSERFIRDRYKEMEKLELEYQSDLGRFRFLKAGGQIGSPVQS